MKAYRALAATAVVAILAASPAFAGQNGRARGQAVAKEAKDKDKALTRDQEQGDDSQIQLRFRGMDKDGDGVITRAEWRGSDQAFRQQDTNGDGVLSGAEVRRVTETPMPPAVTDQARLDQLNTRFSGLDLDNDGRLTRAEWSGVAAAFDRADADHDGIVTRTEFLKVARATPRSQSTGRYADPRENTPGYRAGYDRGLLEGRQAGKEDRAVNGGHWDLEGQRELEQADSGFDGRLGTREDYQAGYRIGFRLGYSQGFGPR